MIGWLVSTLRDNPQLAIFLALAIGYWVGAMKFGSFSLGAVTGTLIAGVLIGQLGIEISSQVKSIFFIMFLFAVGYGVGPQFVRGVASDGAPQALFAAVISVLCLACVYVAAIVAGYGPGFAAGLNAGAQTISASIGVATDTINQLGLPPSRPKRRSTASRWPTPSPTSSARSAPAGSSLSSAPSCSASISQAECKRYEAEMSKGAPAGGMQSAWRQFEMRAYRISESGKAVGKRVAEAEAMVPDARVFIERIRRDGRIIEFGPDTVLQAGDVVAVSGRREVLVNMLQTATEVEDRELLDVPAEAVDVVVTNKAIDRKPLIDLAKEEFARGVYLTKITRGAMSVEIPVLPQTQIYRGDILRLVGTRVHLDRVVQAIGYADRPTTATDMVYVGLGIVLGGLFGALVFPIGGIPITLSTSGGALIAGIIFGWLRTVHPTFGRVPAPVLWFMNSVGLNIFIAVVGISSGPTFVTGLKEAGFGLFFWGLFATSVPMLLAPFIGKYLFRFDPAINLGCCGGARTSTASVAMVADVAKSSVPMLGYTVPYAVSNTLLTLWGLVIVLLIA